jgi:hypothetical protein
VGDEKMNKLKLSSWILVSIGCVISISYIIAAMVVIRQNQFQDDVPDYVVKIITAVEIVYLIGMITGLILLFIKVTFKAGAIVSIVFGALMLFTCLTSISDSISIVGVVAGICFVIGGVLGILSLKKPKKIMDQNDIELNIAK